MNIALIISRIICVSSLSLALQSLCTEYAYRGQNNSRKHMVITPSIDKSIYKPSVKTYFKDASDKGKKAVRQIVHQEHKGLSKQERDEQEQKVAPFRQSLALKLDADNIKRLSEGLFEEVYSYSEVKGDYSIIPVDDFSQRDKIDKLEGLRRDIMLFLPKADAQELAKRQLISLNARVSMASIEAQYDALKDFGISSEDPLFKVSLEQKIKIQGLYAHEMKQKREMPAVRNKHLISVWVQYVNDAVSLNGLEPSNVNLTLGAYDPSENKNAFASNVTDVDATGDGTLIFERPTISLMEKSQESVLMMRRLGELGDAFALDSLQQAAFHEVTHTVETHSLERNFFLVVLDNHGIEIKKALQHQAFIRFCLAQEKQADTLHAIRYPAAAKCAMNAANAPLVSLYKGSYPLIAMAHTNWQILDNIGKKKA